MEPYKQIGGITQRVQLVVNGGLVTPDDFCRRTGKLLDLAAPEHALTLRVEPVGSAGNRTSVIHHTRPRADIQQRADDRSRKSGRLPNAIPSLISHLCRQV